MGKPANCETREVWQLNTNCVQQPAGAVPRTATDNTEDKFKTPSAGEKISTYDMDATVPIAIIGVWWLC